MTASNNERYTVQIGGERTVNLVPGPNREQLNEQQIIDYGERRRRFVEWLRDVAKDPQKRDGYAPETVRETTYKTARFDRWAWSESNGYSFPPEPEYATEYIDNEVAFRDLSNSTKGKTEEALARFFRWASDRTHVGEWDHEQRFRSGGSDGPRDFLTRRERKLVRQAAFNEGPKVTAIVTTSLDAALRPVEVRRARPEWVDVQNKILRIPKEDSSKNEGHWRVSLTASTAEALSRWLDVRAGIDKYDDSDALWLTRVSSRYGSRSLARLLRSLCDAADIDTGGRTMTWYSVRHSTGTYMTHERDLKATKDQLRHKSAKTTMKYDQVPVSQRRDALDKM